MIYETALFKQSRLRGPLLEAELVMIVARNEESHLKVLVMRGVYEMVKDERLNSYSWCSTVKMDQRLTATH